MLRAVTTQLIRDLKASWQKTAVLGLLFVVGLYFWIPPLYRAVTRSSPARVARPAAAVQPTPAPVQAASTPKAAPAETPAKPATGGYHWEDAEELLRSDPLVRSAEVSAIPSDPFRIDPEQFSPPVLFAEDLRKQPPPVVKTPVAESTTLAGLTLKSTIVGEKRRAALINRKLYFEGKELQADGATYRVAAIYPRKVVLTRGNRVFELLLADPASPLHVGLQSDGPEEPGLEEPRVD